MADKAKPSTKRRRLNLRHSVRFQVFERDQYTCRYCGKTPPHVVLCIDHFVPVCEGGGNDVDNLITACVACNSGKGGRVVDGRPPAPTKMTASEIRERSDQTEAYYAYQAKLVDIQARSMSRIEDAWLDAFGSYTQDGVTYCNVNFPFKTVTAKYLETLGLQKVIDAIHITRDQTLGLGGVLPAKYFTGVCRRMLESRRNAGGAL